MRAGVMLGSNWNQNVELDLAWRRAYGHLGILSCKRQMALRRRWPIIFLLPAGSGWETRDCSFPYGFSLEKTSGQ